VPAVTQERLQIPSPSTSPFSAGRLCSGSDHASAFSRPESSASGYPASRPTRRSDNWFPWEHSMPVFLSKITLFGKICLYTIIGMVSLFFDKRSLTTIFGDDLSYYFFFSLPFPDPLPNCRSYFDSTRNSSWKGQYDDNFSSHLLHFLRNR